MDIFKFDNTVHTKEQRKETSTLSYHSVQSSHAKHISAVLWKVNCVDFGEVIPEKEILNFP